MYILDIEASGLGAESYPIEIAWCAIEGNDSFSTLINPESAGGWDYWDDYAESAVHGISRMDCCEKGENVIVTAQRVKQLLTDHLVFSDAPYQDQLWLNQLFSASGLRCPAKLIRIEQAVFPSMRGELSASLSRLRRPHRASDDCLLMREVVLEYRAISSSWD